MPSEEDQTDNPLTTHDEMGHERKPAKFIETAESGAEMIVETYPDDTDFDALPAPRGGMVEFRASGGFDFPRITLTDDIRKSVEIAIKSIDRDMESHRNSKDPFMLHDTYFDHTSKIDEFIRQQKPASSNWQRWLSYFKRRGH